MSFMWNSQPAGVPGVGNVTEPTYRASWEGPNLSSSPGLSLYTNTFYSIPLSQVNWGKVKKYIYIYLHTHTH